MSAAEPAAASARIAIVTRTLNRPVFLERAADSVLAQTYRDFVWVVVNDGGEPEAVERVVARARASGLAAMAIHHATSRGMEAASNAGIAATQSDYIAVHDDDDTWLPVFLEKTMAFLDASPVYVAVVTHTLEVREKMRDDTIVLSGQRLLTRWLRHIQISDLYARNLFPPIAMLFRRTACEAVGGFDESLPVQGDWEFNLRLVMYGDIAVLPEPLARYHIRLDLAKTDAASNSVHGRREVHHEYETLIRNRMLRQALKEGGLAPGILFALQQRHPVKRPPRKAPGDSSNGIWSRIATLFRHIHRRGA